MLHRVPASPNRHAAQGFALTYRPDIDGLRAIAVAAVVLFHAEIPGFSGGYVGVDVFFVISGYLITQLLLGAQKPLRLRLMDFYVRRARRILPALFLTSLFVAGAAIVILLPWDLARFGKYLAATSVLATNVAVWLDGISYFQSRTAHVSITHFWSIAIEEQFYLLYPIVLILTCRYLPRYRTTALAALAAPSFAVCVWGSYYAPAANYFLAPSRAWELLLGGALASGGELRIKSRLVNEMLAVLGLLTLAFTVYTYGPATPYPGWYAIAPCAASAVLILTGRNHPTVTGKMLSLRPLVFTGLISYPLYLLHFPILVLSRYYSIVKLGTLRLIILIACAYIAAAAIWKWVETPIRTRVFLNSTRSFVYSALVVNVVFLGAGVALWNSEGLSRGFTSEIRIRGGGSLFDYDYISECAAMPFDKIAAGNLCSFGPNDDRAPRVVVWGDSHTVALLPAYQKLAVSHHLRLYFAVRSACKPLLGVTNSAQSDPAQRRCANFNEAVAQAVRRINPQLLILNAHWSDADADVVSQLHAADAQLQESPLEHGLHETLRATDATSRAVCVVLDVPTFRYDLPTALGVARKRGIAEDFLKVTRAEALAQNLGAERAIRALERGGLLRSVDPKDLLCSGSSCIFESNGSLLYWDRDHLSWAGALFVSSAIDGCFRDIAAAEPK